MKKIHLGYDLALETCSWAWHYKRLFWYPLIIAFLKYLFESGILTNFFGMMSRYSLLIVKELGISITIVFIFAALTNRFYVLFVNKKMSFFESFHFDEGILPKLVVLTFIFAIADFIKKYFVIGSGINLNYEQATGLQVQIVYAELLIWILSLILFSVWSLMIFYVVPILIKKNESLWVTIKEAFLWVEYRIEMHRLYNNGLFVLLAPEWEKVNSKPSDLITAIIDEQPIVLIPTYEPTVNNEEEVKSSSTKTTFSSLFNRKKQGVHQPLLAESSENDADAEYSLDEEVELVTREKPSEDEIPYSALEVESEPVKNKAVTAKTPLLSRY